MTTATAKAPVALVTNQQRVTERMQSLLTLLNLHFAGLAVLAAILLYLLVQIGVAWNTVSSRDAAAIARQTTALKAAKEAAEPLQGLDAKLAAATTEADRFYGKRLPFAYSEVLGELGALTKKTGVKLTRGAYAEAPVLTGGKGALTEIQMDYGLNGDYRALVTLINALERDRMFFMIGGVTLTGQQSGTVGLRLKLTTYLREPVGAEISEKSVVSPAGDPVVNGAAGAPAGGGGPR